MLSDARDKKTTRVINVRLPFLYSSISQVKRIPGSSSVYKLYSGEAVCSLKCNLFDGPVKLPLRLITYRPAHDVKPSILTKKKTPVLEHRRQLSSLYTGSINTLSTN